MKNMKKYVVAVCGASGMVGNMMLKVLEEKNFPISKLRVFSSSKSAGKGIEFRGKKYILEELKENSFDDKIDIALFSAGGSVSAKFAPIAASKGCVVVDNSSHFRMDDDVPLVVPEVNPEDIKKHKGIIANPNCSTIQSVLPLKPLYDKYGIKRVIYSTYQAVSGAGVAGYNDLKSGINGDAPKKFDYPIAFNLIPQIDVFMDNGYTKEEMKMVNETKKILNDDKINVTATTVRVPVYNSHSVSINIELEKDFDIEEVKQDIANYEGLVLVDDIENKKYPMPLNSTGKNEVFVGRIRRDFSQKNTLNLFCVADNIRKGAATNAVQIAEKLIESL